MRPEYFANLPLKSYLKLTDRVFESAKRKMQESGCTEEVTVKFLARSHGLRYDQVIQIVEDHESLMLNVGIGCGGGVAELPQAEWTVEALISTKEWKEWTK